MRPLRWCWLGWQRYCCSELLTCGLRAKWWCLVTCGPNPWDPGSSIVTGPSGKGTGMTEVVESELTSEAYCWPFPCPGLPHLRCLPDPTESQGTTRLKVTWRHKAWVWERSHRSPCPGLWDMQKPVGSQPEGTLCQTGWLQVFSHGPHLQATPQGHTVPCSCLTMKLSPPFNPGACGQGCPAG